MAGTGGKVASVAAAGEGGGVAAVSSELQSIEIEAAIHAGAEVGDTDLDRALPRADVAGVRGEGAPTPVEVALALQALAADEGRGCAAALLLKLEEGREGYSKRCFDSWVCL